MSASPRLRWKCRRGMLELDLVLQRFLEAEYAQLDAASRLAFEALLDYGDTELWQLIADETRVGPDPDLLRRLRAC